MTRTAVTQLIESREAGGYTLPDDLLAAVDVAAKFANQPAPTAAPPATDAAAARLRTGVASGGTIDLAAIGKEMQSQQRSYDAGQLAWTVVRQAQQQAEEQVGYLVEDLAESIICDHLQPAYEEVLTLAREHAKVLDGVTLDTVALMTAPAKVRDAYRIMAELDARRGILQRARNLTNAAAHRKPQQDTSDQFALLRHPRRLFPGLSDTAPIPREWGIPTQPVERMLWFVTTASPAEPWLPTTTQQDEAHDAVYGEANRGRANAAKFARGFAVNH